MGDWAITTCIVAGVPIAVVDGWLSIQSIFGLVDATTALGLIVALAVGAGLTVFAVMFPVIRSTRPSPAWTLVWWAVYAVDVATSVVGIIWYGMLDHPLNEPVDVTALTWAPQNAASTAVYVTFVLVVAGACAMLGRALNALTERRRRF